MLNILRIVGGAACIVVGSQLLVSNGSLIAASWGVSEAIIGVTIVAFGGETGFLVGAMTMLASNFLFSQGPWTPFQMFAAGIIGFLAGVLFRKGWLRRSRAALCVYGALAAILIYGGLMNPTSALIYGRELNWQVLVSYYLTGFPMDCVHAAATVLFLWVLAEPMLEKLDRIKTKYGLVE